MKVSTEVKQEPLSAAMFVRKARRVTSQVTRRDESSTGPTEQDGVDDEDDDEDGRGAEQTEWHAPRAAE